MCKDRGKCDQKKKRLYRNRCINYKTDGVSNMNDKITFINIHYAYSLSRYSLCFINIH